MATPLQGPGTSRLCREGPPDGDGGGNQAAAPGTGGSSARARYFKSGCSLLQQGTKLRFSFIQEHRGQFEVKIRCRVLRVSQRGYYAWRKRPESRRARANRKLSQHIQAIHTHSRKTYGV